MENQLIGLYSSELADRVAVKEITECNDYTLQYGLTLTARQAQALTESRRESLNRSGRVEFGGGILPSLIHAFCDSPYITPSSYENTLHELTDIFYQFKNETMDILTDEELIGYMRKFFDEPCRGDTELLASRELERIASNLRFGRAPLDNRS